LADRIEKGLDKMVGDHYYISEVLNEKEEQMKKINMRERRHELGLTLEQVAEKSGVSLPTIRQIEVGIIKSSSFLTLQKIADALQVPVRCLMSDEEQEALVSALKREGWIKPPKTAQVVQFFKKGK
jgi:DNA-binding XRE family transcriptional regulator